ncbi:MAG: hypothetical protein HY926_05320 [Elusimicrobia bacterium]|nr:hypothetical protein [Elusimicrobiota bacterium]
MLILLLLLAGLPLLGLESLRWSRQQDNPRAGRKALWLAGSSSVLWSLLGDYVGTAWAGWGWLTPLLFCAGIGYMAHCASRRCIVSGGRRGLVRILIAYAAVFALAVWLFPDWLWLALHENVGPTGALSRWRGPLH